MSYKIHENVYNLNYQEKVLKMIILICHGKIVEMNKILICQKKKCGSL